MIADRGTVRYRILAATGRRAPLGVPRLQPAAWRDALARATTIAAVIDVVQRIAPAWPALSPSTPSCWQPTKIRSREDIEHWARRLRSRSAPMPGDPGLISLAGLMRSAIKRMNELGPRRRAAA